MKNKNYLEKEEVEAHIRELQGQFGVLLVCIERALKLINRLSELLIPTDFSDF